MGTITFNCNDNLLLYKYQYHRSNITIKVIVEIYEYFVCMSYSIENYTIQIKMGDYIISSGM